MKERKKNIIIVLIGCLMTSFILIMGIIIYKENQLKKEEPGQIIISKEEAKDLEDFYTINPESISRGEYFDLKYVYLNPTRTKFIANSLDVNALLVEVVKKDNRPIIICKTLYRDKDGRFELDFPVIQKTDFRIIEEGTSNPSDLFFIPLTAGYKKLGRQTQLSFALIIHSANYDLPVPENQISNVLSTKYDLSELTIGFDLKEGVTANQCHLEEYHLKYDPQQQINALKGLKERCMTSECSAYQKRYVSYYFGTLLRENFNQWYKEMDVFLRESDLKEYNNIIIFDYNSEIDDIEERREALNLSDEQYEKYLEMLKRVER